MLCPTERATEARCTTKRKCCSFLLSLNHPAFQLRSQKLFTVLVRGIGSSLSIRRRIKPPFKTRVHFEEVGVVGEMYVLTVMAETVCRIRACVDVSQQECEVCLKQGCCQPHSAVVVSLLKFSFIQLLWTSGRGLLGSSGHESRQMLMNRSELFIFLKSHMNNKDSCCGTEP